MQSRWLIPFLLIAVAIHSSHDSIRADNVPLVAVFRTNGERVYGSIDIERLKEYDLLAELLGGKRKVIARGEHLGTESSREFLEAVQSFLKDNKR